jgi:hypothetical protein
MSISILRESDLVRLIQKRWKDQYFKATGWSYLASGDSRLVHNRLLALPPDATRADVVEIIGNDSWVSISCNNCNQPCDVVVICGEDYGYSSATARLCLSCAQTAYEAIREASEK